MDVDFDAPAKFTNLAPGLTGLLASRGALNANLQVGIEVPQQVMASIFSQVDDRWALLGSIGWQEWSKFGQVQIGIDNTKNPSSLRTELDFKDTWHVAALCAIPIERPLVAQLRHRLGLRLPG